MKQTQVSVGIAQTWSACTTAGVVLSSVLPLPSCPLELRPKLYSSPSDVTHSVCVSPQEQATTRLSDSAATGFGRNTSPQSPCPSRPKSPLQHMPSIVDATDPWCDRSLVRTSEHASVTWHTAVVVLHATLKGTSTVCEHRNQVTLLWLRNCA
jgi:hypothetical protein